MVIDDDDPTVGEAMKLGEKNTTGTQIFEVHRMNFIKLQFLKMSCFLKRKINPSEVVSFLYETSKKGGSEIPQISLNMFKISVKIFKLNNFKFLIFYVNFNEKKN